MAKNHGENPIHGDYSALTGEIETNHKAPKFKIGDRVRTMKHKSKHQKLVKRNICNSNGEKITVSFYEQ